MPTLRTGFAVAAYKNRIYVIGGTPIESPYETCGVNEAYDPATDSWERKAEMPTKRSNLKAAAVEGKIYLVGGLEAVSMAPPISCQNEVYDPETDTWTAASPIPRGVYGYACAVLDGKIYIMAGHDGDPLPVQIYDPKTDTWSIGSSPPTRVVNAAAAATTGRWAPKKIYLIGGRINYSAGGSNIVQVYNIENNSWTLGASMPTARYNPATAVINDTIYVIGGVEMFNLVPPFGWTAANEQYIPFGYDSSGLEASNTLEDKQTLTLVALLAAATVIISSTTTIAIIKRRKAQNNRKSKKQNQSSEANFTKTPL
ncbi:MAG: hypothetical protein RMJ15_07840 [Nitrososphaerota archaeon]|nr:hypothetical protein [Nitrososphaerota archaeon]